MGGHARGECPVSRETGHLGKCLDAYYGYGIVAEIADEQVPAILAASQAGGLVETRDTANQFLGGGVDDADGVTGVLRHVGQRFDWVEGDASWGCQPGQGFDVGKAIVVGVVDINFS